HPDLAQPPRPEREALDPLVERVNRRREREADGAIAPDGGHAARLRCTCHLAPDIFIVIARSEATRQSRAAGCDALDCVATLAMTKRAVGMGALPALSALTKRGCGIGRLLIAPRPVARPHPRTVGTAHRPRGPRAGGANNGRISRHPCAAPRVRH